MTNSPIEADLLDWPFGMSGHDAIRECYRRGAAKARALALEEAAAIVNAARGESMDLRTLVHRIRALGKDES